MHVRTYACMYVSVHACVCVCRCMYVCMYVCMYERSKPLGSMQQARPSAEAWLRDAHSSRILVLWDLVLRAGLRVAQACAGNDPAMADSAMVECAPHGCNKIPKLPADWMCRDYTCILLRRAILEQLNLQWQPKTPREQRELQLCFHHRWLD